MTFLRWLHLWKCSGATDCTSEPSFGFSIHLKLVIYLRDSKWFQMTRDKIHSPYMRLKKSKDGKWSGNFLDYKTSSFDYYCSIVAQHGNSQYTGVFCNKINLNLKRYPLCSTNCWSSQLLHLKWGIKVLLRTRNMDYVTNLFHWNN